jgi:hypothetical protein
MIDFGFSIDLDITDRLLVEQAINYKYKKNLRKNEIVVTQA